MTWPLGLDWLKLRRHTGSAQTPVKAQPNLKALRVGPGQRKNDPCRPNFLGTKKDKLLGFVPENGPLNTSKVHSALHTAEENEKCHRLQLC